MRHHISLAHVCEGEDTLGPAFAGNMRRNIGAPLPRGAFIYTGIEIEVENVRADEVVADPWTLVQDGSLRNMGMELLSSPIRTAATLTRYCNRYTELRGLFDWQDSIRTSTHVHLDARGLKLPDLVRIVAAYNLVEPFLYQYCGPVREENIYCIPFYRADTTTHGLINAVRTGAFHRFLTETCKYSGLYLGPVRTFGTIEFRMAPSFRTGTSVMEWVLMLQHFYNAALEVDPSMAHEMIDRGEYRELLRMLLPAGLFDLVPAAADLADLLEDHTCDLRSAALYELFLPPKPRKWVMPEMPATTSTHQSRGMMVSERLRAMTIEPRDSFDDDDEEDNFEDGEPPEWDR